MFIEQNDLVIWIILENMRIVHLISLSIILASLAGCTNPLTKNYDFTVSEVGTPTEDLDLLFVLQLDSDASIDFSDIHMDLGKAMGCMEGREGCDYVEKGDMDGFWELGEKIEIYEYRENWCDTGNSSNPHGDCTEITLDIYLNPRSGPQFTIGRSTIQMN